MGVAERDEGEGRGHAEARGAPVDERPKRGWRRGYGWGEEAGVRGDRGSYGGRGIGVCARWRGSFDAFASDVGFREEDGLSLDRIDNEGGYWCGRGECLECGPLGRRCNVRWARDDAGLQPQGQPAGDGVRVDAVPRGVGRADGVDAGTIAGRRRRGGRPSKRSRFWGKAAGEGLNNVHLRRYQLPDVQESVALERTHSIHNDGRRNHG